MSIGLEPSKPSPLVRFLKCCAPTKCPELAYILTGTDPSKITKLQLVKQNNHGAEVLANKVRTLSRITSTWLLCRVCEACNFYLSA